MNISVHTRVNCPFENVERRAESGWEPVTDWVVEIIAEDQGGAGNGGLRDEAEGDAVLIVGVRGVGEVRGC